MTGIDSKETGANDLVCKKNVEACDRKMGLLSGKKIIYIRFLHMYEITSVFFFFFAFKGYLQIF